MYLDVRFSFSISVLGSLYYNIVMISSFFIIHYVVPNKVIGLIKRTKTYLLDYSQRLSIVVHLVWMLITY